MGYMSEGRGFNRVPKLRPSEMGREPPKMKAIDIDRNGWVTLERNPGRKVSYKK